MFLLLMLIFSTLNALRGAGVIPRMFCAFCMGLSVFLLKLCVDCPYNQSIIISLIVFLGMWAGLAFGWGKYLNIFSGNMKYVNEVEIKPIDDLTDKICGKPIDSAAFIEWCFIAMTLRGALFLPCFAALGYFNSAAPFVGLGALLMGAVYLCARCAPVENQTRVGEFIFGGLLGLLISLAV